MARTPTNYTIQNQLSTAAEDIVSAVATNTREEIIKLVFTNTSSSNARSVNVYVVPSGGTAGTTNLLVSKSVQPGKPWICYEAQGLALTAGQKLQASQDAGTDVNVNASGYTVT